MCEGKHYEKPWTFFFYIFFLFTFLMGRYCLTDVWKKWYIICERNANSGRSASANRGVYSVPLERSHAKKSTYLVRQNVFAFAWSVYSILLYFSLSLLKNIPIPHPLYLIKNYYKKDDTWIIKNDFHGYTIMHEGKNMSPRSLNTKGCFGAKFTKGLYSSAAAIGVRYITKWKYISRGTGMRRDTREVFHFSIGW